ncbi:hypothetical protein [Mixta gaviniae]|uniref:hypothetical protein n=1 Tax=Mixta gaviniae TaxID=665914 RepID=UPI0011B0ACB7|nr:hypothetical protein [Mixta gaviniae]
MAGADFTGKTAPSRHASARWPPPVTRAALSLPFPMRGKVFNKTHYFPLNQIADFATRLNLNCLFVVRKNWTRTALTAND